MEQRRTKNASGTSTGPALGEESHAMNKLHRSLLLTAKSNDLDELKTFGLVPKAIIEAKYEDFAASTDLHGTLLSIACDHAELAYVKYVVDVLKADVNNTAAMTISEPHKNENMTVSALWMAVKRGKFEIVQLLVDRGADVNWRNKKDKTALIQATWESHLGIVKFLISRGAEVEAADHFGRTSLMAACFKNNYRLAKCLIECGGADVNRTSNDGESAIFYLTASSVINRDLLKLLIVKGAKPTPNMIGITPLQNIAFSNPPTIKYLALAKDLGENGRTFLSNEVTDALELAGCSLARKKAWYRSTKHAASLWLLAERIRQRLNAAPIDYEAQCPQLVRTLRSVSPAFAPVRLIDTSSESFGGAKMQKIEDRRIIRSYCEANDNTILMHSLIRCERILGATDTCSIGMLMQFAAQLQPTRRLQLLSYALTCAFSSSAQQSEVVATFIRSGRYVRNPTAMIDGTLTALDIVEEMGECVVGGEADLTGFDIVALLQLAVDHVETVTKMQGDGSNVAILVVIVVFLSALAFHILYQVGLVHCEVHRLRLHSVECAIARLSQSACRGILEESLLHIATMGRTQTVCFINSCMMTFALSFHPGMFMFGPNRFLSSFSFAKQLLPDCRTIALLLRCGADANARNYNGDTPLHHVASDLVSRAQYAQQKLRSVGSRIPREPLREQLGIAFELNIGEALRCYSHDTTFTPTKATVQASTVRAPSSAAPFESDADANVPLASGFSNFATHRTAADCLQRTIDMYLRAAVSMRLLSSVTHIDIRNSSRQTYREILMSSNALELQPAALVPRMQAVDSLQCLCARFLRAWEPDILRKRLPNVLAHFVDLH